MSRGLLTKAEREFLQDEIEDVDDQQYRYNIRSRFRARMDRLDEDLQLLEAAGEEELVAEFYRTFSRMNRLEKEVDRLQSRLDDEQSEATSG